MTRPVVLCTCALLATLASFLAAGPAAAQPRENPLERARHHMDLGQEAFARKDFEEAARQFIDAYVASPFPAFLYNAALSNEKGGERAAAAELYRRYLGEEPDATDAAEVEFKIRALLAESPTEVDADEISPGVPAVEISEIEMKSLLSVRTNPVDARIRLLDPDGGQVASFEGPAGQTVVGGTYSIEVSHPDFRTVQTDLLVSPGQVYVVVVEMSQGAFLGLLQVETDVPGAEVFVGDPKLGPVGTTPWSNVLPAGTHRIRVEKPGYEVVEDEVQVTLGGQEVRRYSLTRPGFGTVNVRTNVPDAEVYLGQEPLGAAPLEVRAPPGRHQLRVTAKGMKDYTEEVVVSRGQVTRILVRMNPAPSRTSAWISLGFSVALFAGGGVTGGLALKTRNELEQDRNAGRLADDDPRILKGFLLALGADVGFGVGTIVGALSIYYFLRDPLPPSEGRVYDPVDFEENPPELSGGDAVPAQAGGGSASAGHRLVVAPFLSPGAAGLGMSLAF